MSDKLVKNLTSQHKSIKLRIYPTEKQSQLINQTFGCCRKLYNEPLQERNEFYIDNILPIPKEERITKENLPPTPPIREKAKKEENAHPSGVRAARALAREDVPDLATVLSLSPETGVSEEYARWWHSEMTARDWTSPNGSRITLANWRSVMRAWYLRRNDAEVDAAKRMAIRLILPRPTKMSGYPLAAWDLCRERCANCGKSGCKVGIPTPPPSENPPRPPEECHKFARIGKEAR